MFSPKREIIPLIGTESSWYVHLLAQTVKQALCHFDICICIWFFIDLWQRAHCILDKLCVSKNRKRRQQELKGKQTMRKNVWKRGEKQSKQNNWQKTRLSRTRTLGRLLGRKTTMLLRRMTWFETPANLSKIVTKQSHEAETPRDKSLGAVR